MRALVDFQSIIIPELFTFQREYQRNLFLSLAIKVLVMIRFYLASIIFTKQFKAQ